VREIVVLAGGAPLPLDEHLVVPPDAQVIAADGGLELAAPLGLHVDVIVGDLDSVDPGSLAEAERAGARIEQHPVDKDATDLALALDLAIAAGPDRITVLGGGGGRADHELSLWLLLAAETYAGAEVRAWSGRARTDVVRARRPGAIVGRAGELVSLLPVHGPACGVRTDGLRFPLDREDLTAGSSRGVSNQLLGRRARVTVTDGVLLVVRPGQLGPPLTGDGRPSTDPPATTPDRGGPTS
jgi:thiamine pyrophosphokinase